jgi:hypothetical protein
MKVSRGLWIAIAASLSLAATVIEAKAEGYPVAGVAPAERPAGAPKLVEVRKGDAWEKKAYKGVSKPYPPSIVSALRDQGAWYTPFTRPGMTGRYDIRGLHGE